MARKLELSLLQAVERRSLRRWRRLARMAETLDLARLRGLRGRAEALRRQLDQVIHVADGRLALPLIGSNAIDAPHNADWVFRPALWTGPLPVPGGAAVESKTAIGESVSIFHDCRMPELTFRQLRNRREGDLAPYGLRLEVFGFDGSFLSVVLDLPPEAAQGLRHQSILQLNTLIEVEAPLPVFARLNVRHGPNTEQIVRELPGGRPGAGVEFDLAYTKINEKRVERVWIDLIFESPRMNQITLLDVTLSRRPRAPL